MTLDDMREMLVARRDDIERAYQMYRAGEIPVHVFAHRSGHPLVFWYRRAPLLNQQSSRSCGWADLRPAWLACWYECSA